MSRTQEPVYVNGARIVRLRQRSFPMGLGMSLRMWVVTDTGNRKQLGLTHLDRKHAAMWATAQGWRYLGSQEADA